jgi:chaperonin GroES
MTKIAPLRDHVVVELIESEAVTAGGIVIPDSATEKPSQGIVRAVGTGKYNDKNKFIPVTVKVGDRVLFSKAAGQQLKVDGEIIHIFSEEQIIAVINPK